MFLHVVKYRLLAIIRDRQGMFWMLLFPILLTSMMSVVMMNLINEDMSISPARAAIVKNAAWNSSAPLQDVIATLNADEESLFVFSPVETAAEAEQMLASGDVHGYFIPDAENGLTLHVIRTGFPQTILSEFMSSYTSQARLISDMFRTDPLKALALAADGIQASRLTFEPIDPAQNVSNPWGAMFFTLIAMMALYNALQSATESTAVDPTVYSVGIRQRTMPQHHISIVLSSFAAVAVMGLLNMAVYLLYGQFLLGLDFGLTAYPLYAAAIAISGVFAGIAMGFLISALVPGKRNRHSAVIATSMVMVFLAGMMVLQMRQIVRANAPFLKYLNPADMITDAYYGLLYYGDTARAARNIVMLLVFTAVCLLLTYTRIRRTRYEHL